jgi:hypothetical protein
VTVAAAKAVNARAAVAVSIASTIDDTVTPVLYALRAGLFAKAGLDVTRTGGDPRAGGSVRREGTACAHARPARLARHDGEGPQIVDPGRVALSL